MPKKIQKSFQKIWVTREVVTDYKNCEVNAKHAEAPNHDEAGNPLWPKHYISFCTACEQWLWRGLFAGIKRANAHCTPCRLENEAAKRENKPVPSAGAYTHAIRCEDTKEIFRFSILDFDIPKNYTVIYKTRGGYLLPKKFWRYKPYAK